MEKWANAITFTFLMFAHHVRRMTSHRIWQNETVLIAHIACMCDYSSLSDEFLVQKEMNTQQHFE